MKPEKVVQINVSELEQTFSSFLNLAVSKAIKEVINLDFDQLVELKGDKEFNLKQASEFVGVCDNTFRKNIAPRIFKLTPGDTARKYYKMSELLPFKKQKRA